MHLLHYIILQRHCDIGLKCSKFTLAFVLGAVHKRCPQSEVVQCGHFTNKGGVFQMWTSALFGEKIIGFFKIYGVSARTREQGVESARTF